jgi:hypothetical protein
MHGAGGALSPSGWPGGCLVELQGGLVRWTQERIGGSEEGELSEREEELIAPAGDQGSLLSQQQRAGLSALDRPGLLLAWERVGAHHTADLPNFPPLVATGFHASRRVLDDWASTWNSTTPPISIALGPGITGWGPGGSWAIAAQAAARALLARCRQARSEATSRRASCMIRGALQQGIAWSRSSQ